MTEFLNRGLKILTLTLFLSSHSCYATRYYVNVNNSTPGAGTSWSTAFTDLNAALAQAAIGVANEVWVAQGTYKPTTTSDRTLSFKMSGWFNIYGGFVGTETLVTQRNASTNITILSGDIGVAGNAADNSYHVVLMENYLQGLKMDGFTIRDGNANAGYPASTTLQMNNAGGGVLVYAQSTELGNGELDNCILTANFAVYGGGLCAYGEGGNQFTESFFRLANDKFDNNTAVTGGATALITNNGDLGNAYFEGCIFTNNMSSGGQGSVMSSVTTNPGQQVSVTMYNCVCYNDGAPQFFTQQTNGTTSFQVYDTIIWTSGSPYSVPLASGPGFLLDWCDLDLATPDAMNIDVDPQFLNAAAGDFRVAPCSPVIDAGFQGSQGSDPNGVPRPTGTATDIGVYESQKLPPAALPTVTNQTYCQFATASALTATGTDLLWYTAATGGTGNATAPTPFTTSTGTTDYYVTQTPTGSCESARQKISVKVNPGATAPTATPPAPYCQNVTAAALTATGSNLLWYNAATGGSGSATAPTPSTTGSGSSYWVSQTPAGSCESPRTEVDVTIKPAAIAPTATSPAYCPNVTATALTATGANLLWYNAATGGVGASTAPVPATTANSSYWVSQTPAGSCESPRLEIDVTIKSPATAPTATSPIYCQNATATVLTATGSNLLWYNAATGGVGASTAPVPATTANSSYWVSQTPAGSCESPRQEIDVTIKTSSTAPTAFSPTWCQNAAATALTATGTNLLWYTIATGGTGTPTAPVPSTAANSDYWVSQTPTGSCESIRTPVTVTITPNPTADFTWTDACIGKPALLNVVATSAMQDQYTWDFDNAASATGAGTGPYAVTYDKTGNYNVTLTTIRGTCQKQVQHSVAVNALPVVDIGPVTTTCAGSSVTLVASGASTYQWSPATDLSDPSIGNPIALLQNDMLYTVAGTDANGCTATASITLKVSPDCFGYYFPSAFSPNGDGANDIFRVKTGDDPKSFSMLVFNRIGQKVFESANVGIGWNGTFGGNPAPTGAYVFVIVATTSSGTLVKRQGTVMLVR